MTLTSRKCSINLLQNNMNKKGRFLIFFLFFLSIIFFPLPSLAKKSAIGDTCKQWATNDDCEFEGANLDCQESTMPKIGGASQSFCTCYNDTTCKDEYGGSPDGGDWQCIAGNTNTNDLSFCKSTKGLVKKIEAAAIAVKTCKAKQDCPTDQYCLESKCYSLDELTETSKCNKDADCLIGDHKGVCQQTLNTGTGDSSPPKVCFFTSTLESINCGANQVCSKSTKSCKNDTDCNGLGGAGICKDTICWLDEVSMKKFKEAPSLFGIQAELKIQKPILEINIPQLKFSDVENSVDEMGYLHLPYIGEYMSAIYKVAMVVVSIIGVIMIVVVGVKITVLGGEERVNGFKRIGQIVIGLFIAWGSYAILYNINPDLVQFSTLKVRYIEPIALPDYPEGPINEGEGASAVPFNGQFDANGLDKFEKVYPFTKCLMGTMDLHIGVQPPSQQISFLGTNIKVNAKSVAAYKQVEKEILSSPEPEMKDYVRFIQDSGKGGPSLYSTKKKPRDRMSTGVAQGLAGEHCGFGYQRKKKECQVNNSPTRDMHQAALAIDIVYGSNGDFKFEKGNNPNSGDAKKWCQQYKDNFELQKNEFKKYAGLAERIEKNLADCFNSFANGTNPFTTHPKKFVDIFKKNGFVWGGDFCNANTFRTDAMHFEYWGSCKAMRCNGRP